MSYPGLIFSQYSPKQAWSVGTLSPDFVSTKDGWNCAREQLMPRLEKLKGGQINISVQTKGLFPCYWK